MKTNEELKKVVPDTRQAMQDRKDEISGVLEHIGNVAHFWNGHPADEGFSDLQVVCLQPGVGDLYELGLAKVEEHAAELLKWLKAVHNTEDNVHMAASTARELDTE